MYNIGNAIVDNDNMSGIYYVVSTCWQAVRELGPLLTETRVAMRVCTECSWGPMRGVVTKCVSRPQSSLPSL